jgi:hypothetical protein
VISLRQAELFARHHAALLGDGVSDSTLSRMLGEIDDRGRRRIAKARAAVRARVWGCWPSVRTGSRGW